MTGDPGVSAVLHLVPVAGLPRFAALARQLTAGELAYCAGLARPGEHVAARLAAKQAVARALGQPDGAADVEVVRTPSGRPVPLVTGDLDAVRAAAGVPVPGVSLTHARGHAAALAWLPVSR